MNNTHPAFYRLMGPYLSRREIVEELGFQVWDEDAKTWIIAHEEFSVKGFLSLKKQGIFWSINSVYVLPDYRALGIGLNLLSQAQLHIFWGEIRVVATESGKRLHEKAGFTVTGRKGRFYLMKIILP